MRRVPRSLGKFSGRTKINDASPQPIVAQAASVMFPGHETVYDGTIVGLLASQRGRRIALVRLAVENGPPPCTPHRRNRSAAATKRGAQYPRGHLPEHHPKDRRGNCLECAHLAAVHYLLDLDNATPPLCGAGTSVLTFTNRNGSDLDVGWSGLNHNLRVAGFGKALFGSQYGFCPKREVELIT